MPWRAAWLWLRGGVWGRAVVDERGEGGGAACTLLDERIAPWTSRVKGLQLAAQLGTCCNAAQVDTHVEFGLELDVR